VIDALAAGDDSRQWKPNGFSPRPSDSKKIVSYLAFCGFVRPQVSVKAAAEIKESLVGETRTVWP